MSLPPQPSVQTQQYLVQDFLDGPYFLDGPMHTEHNAEAAHALDHIHKLFSKINNSHQTMEGALFRAAASVDVAISGDSKLSSRTGFLVHLVTLCLLLLYAYYAIILIMPLILSITFFLMTCCILKILFNGISILLFNGI